MRVREPRYTIKVTIEFDMFELLPKRTWRRVLLLLAKDRCEECGSPQFLDCHHIDKNQSNNTIVNGRVLCRSCHMSVHREDKS